MRLKNLTWIGNRRRLRVYSSFVLLEVMVALMILSLGFTAVLQSFSMALKALRRQEVITTSVMLANSLIEDLQHDPTKAVDGSGFWEAYPNYSYEITVEEEEPNYDVDSHLLDKLHANRIWVFVRVMYNDVNRPREQPYIGAEFATCLLNFERFDYNTKLGKLREDGSWEKYVQ